MGRTAGEAGAGLNMFWYFKEIEIKVSFGMAEESDMALSLLAGGWAPIEKSLTRNVPSKRPRMPSNCSKALTMRGKSCCALRSDYPLALDSTSEKRCSRASGRRCASGPPPWAK